MRAKPDIDFPVELDWALPCPIDTQNTPLGISYPRVWMALDLKG
jgi:hypothetical protein